MFCAEASTSSFCSIHLHQIFTTTVSTAGPKVAMTPFKYVCLLEQVNGIYEIKLSEDKHGSTQLKEPRWLYIGLFYHNLTIFCQAKGAPSSALRRIGFSPFFITDTNGYHHCFNNLTAAPIREART